MAIRLFVLDRAGARFPGVRVHLFLRLGPERRLSLAATYTDRSGYAKLDFRGAQTGTVTPNLAALVPGATATAETTALVVEVEGCPETARILLEQAPDDPPSAMALTGDLGAVLDAPFTLQANDNAIRGPVGRIAQPDAIDYALSPESFTLAADRTIGEGACETIAPATLPLRQYSILQVVVLAEPKPPAAGVPLPSVEDVPAPDSTIQWGQLLEYRQTWRSLGHSLGEIKYSLTLAPGEAAKVAVIDWKRTDDASRLATNASKDAITHAQTVDRDIDDIVSGHLEEKDQGSSFMAGLAGAADFQLPQIGLSAAGRHSIGTGASYTQGTRDLLTSGHQDAHQQTVQRTNLARSQSSTVVVQATQQESSYLATRIVANMNRGHSLTVLYYEILRHLSIRTEFVRAAACILIPVAPIEFTRGVARRYRALLEPVLLDPRYAVAFDAIDRADAGIEYVPPPTPPAPPAPPSSLATALRIEFRTRGRRSVADEIPDTGGKIDLAAVLAGGERRQLVDVPSGTSEQFKNLQQTGAANWVIDFATEGGERRCVASFTLSGISIDLRSVERLELGWEGLPLDGWNLRHLEMHATTASGTYVVTNHDYVPSTGQTELFVGRITGRQVDGHAPFTLPEVFTTPPPTVEEPAEPPPPPPPASGRPTFAPGATDEQLVTLLVNHLTDNKYYYSACVWLQMDARERRQRIAAIAGPYIGYVADFPVAMSGNHLVFRFGDALPAALAERAAIGIPPQPLETVTSLPTRGVFAEAQLGHCNAAEERDITRYWSFDELPVSLLPNIADLVGGPKGSLTSLSPDAVAASPLAVQETPALPDPGASIAKALELMGKSDLFRDMSARQEVAQVMAKLIEAAKPPTLTGSAIGAGIFGDAAGGGAGTSKAAPTVSSDPSSPGALMDRDPKTTLDASRVLDKTLATSDLSTTDKREIRRDFAQRSAPPRSPRKASIAISLSSRIQDLAGATRAPDDGWAVLTFQSLRTPAGGLTLPVQVTAGSGVAELALPDDNYRVLASYHPTPSPAALNFLAQPQLEEIGMNGDAVIGFVYDLIQKDLDALVNKRIRSTTANVTAKTTSLALDLDIDLDASTAATWQMTLGTSAGIKVGADGKVSFEGDLKSVARQIFTKIKGAGAAVGALLSMVTLNTNLTGEGHFENTTDSELKLAFTPRYIKDVRLKALVS